MKCRVGYGQMNAGLIASEIRTAILSITSVDSKFEVVFGFGSFFRGEAFNDIDLLAVASFANRDTLHAYYELLDVLNSISLQRPIHLTVLTGDEFKSKPLRDMDQLQCLWRSANFHPI
jgi:predicted nucleotidyltransferase